ncbi:MAG: DUF1801 domain-containing protein [Flavobacteriales bacterium]|nr:DUF1801 domain-containing protein [Flavobacteriales bacterium]
MKYTTEEVKNYVEGLETGQKELINVFREAVLSTDDRMKEGIKWGSVAFFNQKNICGFRVAKAHVTLLFMEGAFLNDTFGILQGDGAKARTYKVKLGDEINREAIQSLVKEALEKGN